MSTTFHRRLRIAAALGTAGALIMAGCAQTSGSNTGSGGSGATLTIGTTDKVTTLDPAGSYDNGSFFLENQVYPFLMASAPGATDPTPSPSIATSASFTSPTEYTVKLKTGLKFANGNELTSSDVKFTFDRVVKINDANGPASLLENLESVAAPDATTVVFKLKAANDQTFPSVLTTAAAPIVDEQVFPADKLLSDEDIAKAHPFAGQYDITSYSKNQLVALKRYDGYQGSLGAAKNAALNLKYYADSNNLKLDVQQSNIDVAFRSLSATDIESLRGDSKVSVHEGPGGETRYMVFNLDTMPFGAKAADASAAKALAVRQAIADLVDRDAISNQVFKGTYSPLYSPVAQGMLGATTPLKTLYGDGNGKPSLDKAKKVLADAGITGPVRIKLQYAIGHYGPSSGDEYAMIKSQVENGGLFSVDLQSTEWVQYSKDRTADVYPVYQLGWFPDFSDPDNYLTPFFTKNNFLKNHYDNGQLQQLISQQATEPDKAKRVQLLSQIQEMESRDLSTLPLLQGKQIVISGKSVKGVTLDSSYIFRTGLLSK